MLDALRLDSTGAFLVLLELGLVVLGREGLDLGCIFGVNERIAAARGPRLSATQAAFRCH